jgi:hypothetical protein
LRGLWASVLLLTAGAASAAGFCVSFQGSAQAPAQPLAVQEWSGGSLVAERVVSASTEWPPQPVTLGMRRWEPIQLQLTQRADVLKLGEAFNATQAQSGRFAAPGGFIEVAFPSHVASAEHALRFANPVVTGVVVPALPDAAPRFEFELSTDQQLAGNLNCRKAPVASGTVVSATAVQVTAEGLEPLKVLRTGSFRSGLNLIGESGGLRSGQMRLSPRQPELVRLTIAAHQAAGWVQWFQDVVVQFRDQRRALTLTLLDAAGKPSLSLRLLDALPVRLTPQFSEGEITERYVLEIAPTRVEFVLPKP